jgi:hypothetical protein
VIPTQQIFRHFNTWRQKKNSMLIETNWLNMLVDRGENKGCVIQADQVWFGNHIPGHLGVVLIHRDTLFHGVIAHSGSRPHCWGFTITLRHTTLGRTPLDEWSARRKDRYLHNTQHSQKTDIHAPGGIRTLNPSKRAAVDPYLRPCGHWDRHRSRGMHTWTLAVDENGYTLRLAWELPAFLVDENGYDFEAFYWPWTKTDIPVLVPL